MACGRMGGVDCPRAKYEAGRRLFLHVFPLDSRPLFRREADANREYLSSVVSPREGIRPVVDLRQGLIGRLVEFQLHDKHRGLGLNRYVDTSLGRAHCFSNVSKASPLKSSFLGTADIFRGIMVSLYVKGKENGHVQAYAPTGAMGLKRWGGLTSKLDGLPIASDPHLWWQACP